MDALLFKINQLQIELKNTLDEKAYVNGVTMTIGDAHIVAREVISCLNKMSSVSRNIYNVVEKYQR